MISAQVLCRLCVSTTQSLPYCSRQWTSGILCYEIFRHRPISISTSFHCHSRARVAIRIYFQGLTLTGVASQVSRKNNSSRRSLWERHKFHAVSAIIKVWTFCLLFQQLFKRTHENYSTNTHSYFSSLSNLKWLQHKRHHNLCRHQ